MGALILALIPIYESMTAAGGIGAALTTITLAEWVTIGIRALGAGPEVMDALKALHPALDQLVADLKKNGDVQNAAANVRAWLAANSPGTIPGYAADGGVTEISNPDTQS